MATTWIIGIAACLLIGTAWSPMRAGAAEPTLADRQAIEGTLSRANIGFELSDR